MSKSLYLFNDDGYQIVMVFRSLNTFKSNNFILKKTLNVNLNMFKGVYIGFKILAEFSEKLEHSPLEDIFLTSFKLCASMFPCCFVFCLMRTTGV